MNNLLEKAQALQNEIELTIQFNKDLEAKYELYLKKEEEFRVRNLANAKTVSDLAEYQKQVKDYEAKLIDREKQILIKERTISGIETTLIDQKTSLNIKSHELDRRENKILVREGDISHWEKKLTIAADEVEKQRLLNLKEQGLDEIRKEKIKIKEQRIEGELSRLSNLTT